MVVCVVLDDNGMPLCCEMWPGNTTDVKTLLPVVEGIRKRFCVVADRGMISQETLKALEDPANSIPYIVGTRMRKAKEINKEVHPLGKSSKDPSPLQLKEAWLGENRYIVCLRGCSKSPNSVISNGEQRSEKS
jgi:transposase